MTFPTLSFIFFNSPNCPFPSYKYSLLQTAQALGFMQFHAQLLFLLPPPNSLIFPLDT